MLESEVSIETLGSTSYMAARWVRRVWKVVMKARSAASITAFGIAIIRRSHGRNEP